MSQVDSNLEEDVLNDQTSDEGHDASDEALTAFNRKLEEAGLPGTFKSFDDVAKSLKEAKKLASESGRKSAQSEGTQKPADDDLLVRLYRQQNPEIDLVWEDLQDTAKRLKTDPVRLYENDTYFKNVAKMRAEEKKQKENESKISKPQDGAAYSTSDFKNMTFDQISALPKREDRIKAYEALAGR